MKGLKKVALASAIAAVSAGAQAELKALDDSQMGELTGQAGLTIDIETKMTIGEFMYKDAGSLLISNIALGGNEEETGYANAGGSYLDNIRMTIDIAGAGAVDASGNADNVFNYGSSEIGKLAGYLFAVKSNGDAGVAAGAVSNLDVNTNLYADSKQTYGDGDLVIHWGFTDAWQKGGGFLAYELGSGTDGNGGFTDQQGLTYAHARDIATRAVDYNFSIEAIGLASSSYQAGDHYDASGTWMPTTIDSSGNLNQGTGIDTDTSDTVLISHLDFRGYLGNRDLHIENNGNGFGGNTGRGEADSKIYLDSFFRVTDLDLYIDIAGVYLEGVEIKNDRGDLSSLNVDFQYDGTGAIITDSSGNPVLANTSALGFAHSKREIYAIKDAVLHVNQGGYVDGLALNTQFKGDIDIDALSFGDTGKSIGNIYLTDIESDTKWTISAH